MLSLVGVDNKNSSFSSDKTSQPVTVKEEQETKKINEKNQHFEEKNLCNHVCTECKKSFFNISDYEKHTNQFSGKHKYYKCCNKFENSDNNHLCNKTPLKNNSVAKSQITSKQSVQTIKKEKVQPFNKNSDDNDDDDNDDDDDDDYDDNESNYVYETDSEDNFDEGKFKKKRVKGKFSHHEEPECKIYKCQKCLQLFSKYASLSYHSKVVHKKKGKFKCLICDEDFNTDEDFKYHKAMHGPEDKIMCKGCKKTFNSLKLYYIHAKQNPLKHCFICKLCLRRFPTEFMLEQHVCICQNGKPLHCACGKEFTKYKDVIDHSKGTKPFSCCSCPHVANSLTAYIRHLRKHSKQKPYQCTKCDMKFAVIDFLNIHTKKCHFKSESELSKEQNSCLDQEVKEHLCNLCNEKFKAFEDLSKHISEIHKHKNIAEDERVQCPDCGKLLKKNRLENHRNTHKTSASLCPECGKLFDARFKLTQHIITAHNNEPVKCEVCTKVLKTKKILNEHMKTHLKSELGRRIPQAICPMCGLGLAQKGSLARHILLTHEKHKIVPCNKTYTCSQCSAVLPNRAKYYSHRRMHRAMVDRFPCQVCGREFNKKQNLKRHIYLLHDETRVLADPIFKCQFCTRCFREKKNLKRHYKMVHKVDDIV